LDDRCRRERETVAKRIAGSATTVTGTPHNHSMSRPPFDPRYRPAVEQPSWEGVLASYALVPALLLLLWLISQPRTATVVLTATAGVLLGVRRALELARCVSDCGGFSVDLGGKLRITIAQPHADDLQ
jgi:hypothetical protein